MAQIEVILPKMGESVAEATITTWLKSEGDTVESEEAIVETIQCNEYEFLENGELYR